MRTNQLNTVHRSLPARVLAVVLCLVVVAFFSALVAHHHGPGVDGDHAAHCQVCALGHTMAAVATAVGLTLIMHVMLLARSHAPTRGSPQLLALPTTRPPPASR